VGVTVVVVVFVVSRREVVEAGEGACRRSRVGREVESLAVTVTRMAANTTMVMRMV
jgi:hypothetical protein